MTEPTPGPYDMDRDYAEDDGPARVLTGRLWGGGIATAVVAMLVALVGVLFVRGVLDVPVIAPVRAGVVGEGTAARYASAAVLAALLATALLHLLMVTIPRPRAFFSWIVTLATIAAGLLPFLGSRSLETQVATGLINVAVGVCIGSLLLSVAARSVHRPRPGRSANQTVVDPGDDLGRRPYPG
jgi:hypothetical protein